MAMSTIRMIGIPLEEVVTRLKELHEALSEKEMAVGADTDVHLNITDREHVNSATITVYFFQTPPLETKNKKDNDGTQTDKHQL